MKVSFDVRWAVVLPIMNDQPMGITGIEPFGFNKVFYQFVWVSIPLQFDSDCLVVEPSDVSLGSVLLCEMPKRFQ